MAAPSIKQVLNGINCTIFAYGQTGSGKTYTTFSETGIATNCIGHIFAGLNTDEKDGDVSELSDALSDIDPTP